MIPGMPVWFNICKSIKVIYHINRMKNKNHMIFSIDVQRNIWQNSTLFYDKAFKNCERESYTWIYKGYISQTHNKQNQWWKAENFSSKIKNKIWVPALTIPIQPSTRNSSQRTSARKKSKVIQIRKEEIKWFLFVDVMIL